MKDNALNNEAKNSVALNKVVDFRAFAQARSRRRHPSAWIPDASPPDVDDHSPDALWRSDFEVHAGQHAEVTTTGMWVLAPVVDEALRTSLPAFQLGEIGTGRHLLDSACGLVSEDHLQALRLFIIESQEHARLLALVCGALDIEMIDEHWSERIFRMTRHRRGARFELLAIIIAQLISAEIYSTIAVGVGDPALSRIFHRLATDELRHLEFHSATLPAHLSWPRPIARAIRLGWIGAAHLATVAVGWENRSLLSSCGRTRRGFVADLSASTLAQSARLFGR